MDAAEEMHHNPGAKLINRGFSLCLMVKLVLHRCSPTQDYRRSSGTDRKGKKAQMDLSAAVVHTLGDLH